MYAAAREKGELPVAHPHTEPSLNDSPAATKNAFLRPEMSDEGCECAWVPASDCAVFKPDRDINGHRSSTLRLSSYRASAWSSQYDCQQPAKHKR